MWYLKYLWEFHRWNVFEGKGILGKVLWKNWNCSENLYLGIPETEAYRWKFIFSRKRIYKIKYFIKALCIFFSFEKAKQNNSLYHLSSVLLICIEQIWWREGNRWKAWFVECFLCCSNTCLLNQIRFIYILEHYCHNKQKLKMRNGFKRFVSMDRQKSTSCLWVLKIIEHKIDLQVCVFTAGV